SIHLTDESLAGSDVCATGYALAKVLESESPGLVLLGQQSDDGECYTIGAVVADHLKMPSLTQVIEMDVEEGKLRCRRQAPHGCQPAPHLTEGRRRPPTTTPALTEPPPGRADDAGRARAPRPRTPRLWTAPPPGHAPGSTSEHHATREPTRQ